MSHGYLIISHVKMSKSAVTFNRWNSITKSTWSFQVFNKYNDELNNMTWAHAGASKSIYKNLGLMGAKWKDPASKYFEFDVPKGEEAFLDLQSWSNSFNNFHNWVNLNSLMAISSNLETYIATVVSLALESNPGILFDSPKSIDGVVLLKKGAKKSDFNQNIITSVTKGDWNSRVSAFKKTFGDTSSVVNFKIGDLEKIRNLRNKVGHAFGRDIDGSRNHEVKEILTIESLSDVKLKKYQKLIWSTAKSIDVYLLNNHIGEFQAISFYHRLFDSIRKDIHQSEKAIILKKKLGRFGDIVGKEFCKGLVLYYEEI